MHKKMLLLFVFELISTIQCQIQIEGTLYAGQEGANYTVPLTDYGPTDYIQAVLSVTNGVKLSTTSMIINFQRSIQPFQFPLQYFYHKEPRDYVYFDLDAMWSARQQYVNLRRYVKPNAYITIVNYDPEYRQQNIDYKISIGPPGFNFPSCFPCANNERYDIDCFCRNCKSNTFGKLCSRTMEVLQNQMRFTMSPYSFKYFSVLNTQKSIIQITISGRLAEVYLQYESFAGEVASYYNSVKDGKFMISNKLKISIDSSTLRLLITLVSFSSLDMIVQINYAPDKTLSLTAIILISVFGGIILIFLIIFLIFIIRRKCTKPNRTAPLQNSDEQRIKLTHKQIQFYFPSCRYSDLLQRQKLKPDSSLINLNNQNSQSVNELQAQLQCVICLQKITAKDTIKIGYCKHIVHAQCLRNWFKKQRNCPYCRKQYTRSHTITQYNNLVSQNNNTQLKDLDLIMAIYNQQYSTIFFNLQQKKLQNSKQEEQNLSQQYHYGHPQGNIEIQDP